MLRPRLVLFTLAVGTLAGCVSYQPKDLNPAKAQAQLESRTLGDPGLQQFLANHGQPAASEAWDVARLTLAAFYFSPELEVARAQLVESEAGVRTAQTRPNPTFTFTPGYNVDSVAGVTPWILDYALAVPLELAGKRGYRTAEAQHQAEVARFELARVAWSTRATVRRALSELHGAEATAEFWRSQKPLLAQTAKLVELQVSAGEVSSLGAGQARIALNRAELTARDSEHAVIQARSRLAEAIGVTVTALADIRLSSRGLAEPAAPFDGAEARRWAAQNRSDLLAALAVYAASQSALQGEIARQYPDLSIGPGYQLDQGEGKWSLGLGVTLPLLNQNQGPIAAAQARREVAAARFLAMQNRILAEVDRALANYTSAIGNLAAVEEIRTDLEKQTKAFRAQQESGEISRVELNRALIELADNTRAKLEAQLRVEQAVGTLEDAVQRPLAWPESAWRTVARSNAQ